MTKEGYNAKAIANVLIQYAKDEDKPLTHMQLHKLIYFIQAVSYAERGVGIVSDNFQAWPFGPVILPIYEELRGSGKKNIRELIPVEDNENIHDEADLDLIKRVWEKLGELDGWRLSALTHIEGGPWKQIFERKKSNIIPKALMKQYYMGERE